jgi:hypothetical protein
MTNLRTSFAALLIAFVLPASADAVLDWNERGVAAVTASRFGPPEGARIMAMMHVAMYNAINAVQARYAPYRFESRAKGEASAEAAGAAAAHVVLAAMVPQQKESIDQAYQASLQSLAGRPGVDAGVAIGEEAGRHCVEMRGKDGVGAPNLYRPVTTPGKYVMTALPVSFDWQAVKPWFMSSSSQFRPEPPPALTSAVWARDYNEIKEVGGKQSTRRTEAQTETARFWTIVGIASWNPVVRALAASQPRSLIDNARLFALVNMAATDAFIAVFDAKYAHQFWRPITAIRNGDIDGNDATEMDPAWVPFVDTPMHPEYPCAHCITSSAVATVLESEFGDGDVAAIAITSSTAPGVAHRWTRIRDYTEEVSNARIWGGIHYRNSTEVGRRMGREIGLLAVKGVPKA